MKSEVEKMKTREDRRMAKLAFFFSSKNVLFGHISIKATQSPFGAWSLLSIHIQFTPSERPKKIVN